MLVCILNIRGRGGEITRERANQYTIYSLQLRSNFRHVCDPTSCNRCEQDSRVGKYTLLGIYKESILKACQTLLVVILSAVSFVPLLVLPSKPPCPPTTTLIDPDSRTNRPSFFNGLRALSKNLNFWLLFLVHGLNVGNSIALGTIFTQIISPFGYTDAQAGQLNAVSFFAGTLGCCKKR